MKSSYKDPTNFWTQKNFQKKTLYDDFKENEELFFQNLNKCINIINQNLNLQREEILSIFRYLFILVDNFPSKIINFLNIDFINHFYQSVTDINDIELNIGMIELFGAICLNEENLIQQFNDNDYIQKIYQIYSTNRTKYFCATAYFLGNMIKGILPQNYCFIIDYFFPSVNDFCFAYLKGDFVLTDFATSFIYSMVKDAQNLNDDMLNRFFDVINTLLPVDLPNYILVRVLWIYKILLNGYRNKIDILTNEKIAETLSNLLEDNQDLAKITEKINSENEDVRMPILQILNIFFTVPINENIFHMLISNLSFDSILHLTFSNESNLTELKKLSKFSNNDNQSTFPSYIPLIQQYAFYLIKNIINFHPEMLDELISRNLLIYIKEGLLSSYIVKEAAYNCAISIIQTSQSQNIFRLLIDESFILIFDYISALTEAQQNRFAQFLIHALDTVQQYGPEYLILISHFFESNGIMTILENICKDEVYCSIKKDLNLI